VGEGGGGRAYCANYRPIKNGIILVTLANKQVAQELAQVRVVWFIIKSQRAGIVQKGGELTYKNSSEKSE
jgi:hypothetical protein